LFISLIQIIALQYRLLIFSSYASILPFTIRQQARGTEHSDDVWSNLERNYGPCRPTKKGLKLSLSTPNERHIVDNNYHKGDGLFVTPRMCLI